MTERDYREAIGAIRDILPPGAPSPEAAIRRLRDAEVTVYDRVGVTIEALRAMRPKYEPQSETVSGYAVFKEVDYNGEPSRQVYINPTLVSHFTEYRPPRPLMPPPRPLWTSLYLVGMDHAIHLEHSPAAVAMTLAEARG